MYVSRQHGFTALMKAAINGYQSIVVTLLERNVDMEAKDRVSCCAMYGVSRIFGVRYV
jgi:hypothetical protein